VLGPSATAARAATYRLSVEREPWAPGDPQLDERLALDVASARAERAWMRRHFEARTRFFDRVVVGALRGGLTQLVAVGAGYDGRAWRYASPTATWFEVDHPRTQADKRARLARLGAADHAVRFVAVDLAADPLGPALLGAGFDADAPALFTSEGVAPYLAADDVCSMVRALGAVAAPGSRLGLQVGMVAADRATAARHAALGRAVAGLGEPLRSRFEVADVEDLLASGGWHELLAGRADLVERRRRAGLFLAARDG
jgi:methyltransferase (TIGR00027 family)